MSWIDEITDPSTIIPSQLYNALVLLSVELTAMKTAFGIGFTYDAFFSSLTDNVDEALKQIADYLISDILIRSLLGDFTVAALADATTYFRFLMTRDRTLGLIILKVLTTAPSTGDLKINILKNGGLIDDIIILNGTSGPEYKDLSHTTVVLGDIIEVRVVDAKAAVGLICTLEN